jgi:hypothetical protein
MLERTAKAKDSELLSSVVPPAHTEFYALLVQKATGVLEKSLLQQAQGKQISPEEASDLHYRVEALQDHSHPETVRVADVRAAVDVLTQHKAVKWAKDTLGGDNTGVTFSEGRLFREQEREDSSIAQAKTELYDELAKLDTTDLDFQVDRQQDYLSRVNEKLGPFLSPEGGMRTDLTDMPASQVRIANKLWAEREKTQAKLGELLPQQKQARSAEAQEHRAGLERELRALNSETAPLVHRGSKATKLLEEYPNSYIPATMFGAPVGEDGTASLEKEAVAVNLPASVRSLLHRTAHSRRTGHKRRSGHSGLHCSTTVNSCGGNFSPCLR